jgi:thymidylate synthase
MGNNLDRQYNELVEHILRFGVEKKDRTLTGTKSIFGWQLRHNMKEGFPLLTCKKVFFKGVITELLWFLRGDTNIKFLVDNDCHIWDGDCYKAFHNKFPETEMMSKEDFIETIRVNDEFAKKHGELGKIYGYQWRNWNGEVDQISQLIKQLKENPDSRRLLVSAWNSSDLPHQVLPPCHYGFQMYTRELSAKERTALGSNGSTKLYDFIKESNYETIDADVEMHKICDEVNIPTRAISLMWSQRSCDVFLGIPFNIASYGLLLMMIADEVNMVPDQLIGNLGDVHLYNNHIEQAKEQIGRTPFELPTVHVRDGIESYMDGDIILENYKSHPSIKAPLSN